MFLNWTNASARECWRSITQCKRRSFPPRERAVSLQHNGTDGRTLGQVPHTVRGHRHTDRRVSLRCFRGDGSAAAVCVMT